MRWTFHKIALLVFAAVLPAMPASAQLTAAQKGDNLYPACTAAQYAAPLADGQRWGALAKAAGNLWVDDETNVYKVDWADCGTRKKLTIYKRGFQPRGPLSDYVTTYALDPAGGFQSASYSDGMSKDPYLRTYPDRWGFESSNGITVFRVDGSQLKMVSGKSLAVLDNWHSWRRTSPAEVELIWRLAKEDQSARSILISRRSIPQMLAEPVQAGAVLPDKKAPVNAVMINIADGVVTWTLLDLYGDALSVVSYRPAAGQTSVAPSGGITHPWLLRNDPRITGPMEITPEGVLTVRTQKATIRFDRARYKFTVFPGTKPLSLEAEGKAKLQLIESGTYDELASRFGPVELLRGRIWRTPLGYEHWEYWSREWRRMRLYDSTGEKIGYCEVEWQGVGEPKELTCNGKYLSGSALTIRFTEMSGGSFVRDGKRWIVRRPFGKSTYFEAYDGSRLTQTTWPALAQVNLAAKIREDKRITKHNAAVDRRNRERDAQALREVRAALENSSRPYTPPDPDALTAHERAVIKARVDIEAIKRTEAIRAANQPIDVFYLCFADVMTRIPAPGYGDILFRYFSRMGRVKVAPMGAPIGTTVSGYKSVVLTKKPIEENFRKLVPLGPNSRLTALSCQWELTEARYKDRYSGWRDDMSLIAAMERHLRFIEWEPKL